MSNITRVKLGSGDASTFESRLNALVDQTTKTGKVQQPIAPSVSTYALGGSKRFILYLDGKPMNPEEFMAAAIDIMNQGQILEERGAAAIELEALRARFITKHGEAEGERMFSEAVKGIKTTVFGSKGITGDMNKVLDTSLKATDYNDQFSIERSKIDPNFIFYSEQAVEPNEANKQQILMNEILNEFGGFEATWPRRLIGVEIQWRGDTYLVYGTVYTNPQAKDGNYYYFKDGGDAKIVKQLPIPEVKGAQPVEAGHRFADQSQGATQQLQIFEEIAATTSNVKLKMVIEKMLPTLRKYVEQIQAIDKIAITPQAYAAGNGADSLVKQFIDQAITLGADEILIVQSTTGGLTLDTKVVKQEFEFSAEIFIPEFKYGNRIKGRAQQDIRNAFAFAIKALVTELQEEMLGKPGSSSMITEAIMKQMAEILGKTFDKQLQEQLLRSIKTRKGKKAILAHIKLPEQSRMNVSLDAIIKEHRASLKAALAKIEQETEAKADERKNRRRARNKAQRMSSQSETVDYGSVVHKLNAHLRDAIVKRMVSPSLVNRTGNFANNVSILSASPKVIEFTYAKTPYGVFSQRYGAPPWNSVRKRDPQTLIREAIREVASARLPGVFQDRIYIKEL